MLNSHKSQGPPSTTNKAEALLQKYFIQVTRGCGDSTCSNSNCFSNVNRSTTIDPADSNAAAVLALNLLRTRAELCSLLASNSDNQVSPSPNQSVPPAFSSPGEASTALSAAAAVVAEENSAPMDCVDIDSKPSLKESEYLTEKRILSIINECETKNDYSQLRRVLGEIFYSADSVKKSFLVSHSTDVDSENDRLIGIKSFPIKKSGSISCNNGGGINLDLSQVRSAFRALFDVPGLPFQQTLIDAIKYLMENIEVELRYRRAYEQDPDILNVFILILEMPVLHEPEFIQQAFPAFCKAAAQLPDDGQVKLAKFLSSYTESQLLNVVHAVQQSITVRLLSGNYGGHHPVQEDEAISGATKLLRVFYYAALYGGLRDGDDHLNAEKEFYEAEDKILENLLRQEDFRGDDNEENGGGSKEKAEARVDPLGKKLGVRPIDTRRPLIPFEEFYNETLSEVIEIDKDFLNYKADVGRFTFMHYPFILLPATKMQSMFFDNRIRMYSERRHALVQTLLGAPANPYLRLRVRRSHLVEDSLTTLEIIAMDSPGDLKKQLYVEFEDEQGVDEGGVSKEFYQLITAELFNPDHGMFTYHPDSRLYWFNSRCLDSAAEYTLIGTLFGLAIYNNIIVDVQFPMVVYKKLLGKLGTLEDLKDVDATLYSSLVQILKYDGDDFEDVFACTFRIMCTDCYGEQYAHDLKANGNDLAVTKDNRQEFVNLYADYLLNRAIEQQFHAFRRGFCMVCTSESPLCWLFRPDEIEQLVCGSKSFDFMTLERSTDYDNGYSAEHATVKLFWEVIHEMTEDQKRLFMRFVTGSDRIPIGGMSKLKFIIARNGPDSEKLPTAHTCFNVLLLPEYGNKEKLKERLLKAITYCEGFGLM